ncbi:hemolysin family protein [Patulibacter brassicae]|jgi:CBS domain containing-hemolysin-like protein|uniref:Hemolysin family protein n=1 Tax=Patulibacter brassicae TaxID=1705717 RepID=A0ABU4VMV2_9ACTN|nr:hemolysin family protein [Patulibacter brassicae]MDX8153171.1 hemolysin family protein [Patulibacter brassicae]
MSDGLAILLAVFLLGANAFFVGAEFALISARRTTIEPRAEEGSWAARVTLGAMERVSLMMAGAQLGITICSLGLGALGEPAVAHTLEGPFEDLGVSEALLHPISFVIALSIVVTLHVVIGEMVPKNLALARPDRAAMLLGPPLVLVVRVLGPLIVFLNWVANVSLRLMGVQPKDEITSVFTRDEVAGLVEESHREGLLEHGEGQLLLDALEFEDRDVRSVLLPEDRLVTVPAGATLEQVEEVAGRTGFSRFPVVGSSGELRGYLHVKDLLHAGKIPRDAPLPTSLVRELPSVRETDRLRSALGTMQRAAAHLAEVRSATGTTQGVVALEDVLEELVGEIRDESQRQAVARTPGVRPAAD